MTDTNTDDLVKRLQVRRMSRHGDTEIICSEAAARIVELEATLAAVTAERDRLREAIKSFAEMEPALTALEARGWQHVPEGFVVVPKEPTPEMIEKGKQKIFGGSAFDGEDRHEIYVDVYRSIINARK